MMLVKRTAANPNVQEYIEHLEVSNVELLAACKAANREFDGWFGVMDDEEIHASFQGMWEANNLLRAAITNALGSAGY